MSAHGVSKGLAMDRRMLRCLIYSMLMGLVLSSIGILFIENEYLWVYVFAVCLIPASAAMSAIAFSLRCTKLSKVLQKEKILVGVKNSMDTLQLLELKDTRKCTGCGHTFIGYVPGHCPVCGIKNDNANSDGDPLTGSPSFCLFANFLMYYSMILYVAIFLLTPVLGNILLSKDNSNLAIMIVTLAFMSVSLFAFWLEYYTCCKKKYPVSAEIMEAAVIRCPYVSYIELERTIMRKT
jgi:hypothetical protein